MVPVLAGVRGAKRSLASVLQLGAGVPRLLGASGAASSEGRGGKREGRDSSGSWKDGLWCLKHLFAGDAEEHSAGSWRGRLGSAPGGSCQNG